LVVFPPISNLTVSAGHLPASSLDFLQDQYPRPINVTKAAS
jgi:hypothetical protein